MAGIETERVTRFPPCPRCGTAEWERREEGVWTTVQKVRYGYRDPKRGFGAYLTKADMRPTPGTEDSFWGWWQCGNGHEVDEERITEVLEEAL